MLQLLSTPSPRNGFRNLPVYGLMDYDPDGIAILSVYKHGSAALEGENESLVVPAICSIGLSHSHIRDGNHTHESQGLLPLTSRDRKKARSMLNQGLMADGGLEPEWRLELQIMLILNIKAEMQIVDSRPDGLEKVIRIGIERQS